MSTKQNNTLKYGLIGLFALITVSIAIFYFKKPTENIQANNYTLLSHNVANIQTNPIEYKSTLALLSTVEGTSDESLRIAAQKLLAIDNVSYDCRHETAALEKALFEVLKAYYQVIDNPKKPQKIKKEIETFLSKGIENHGPERYDFTVKQTKFGTIDKTIRQQGKIRFSPTYYSDAMADWFAQERDAFDIESFTEEWIEHMEPCIKALYMEKKLIKEDIDALRHHYLLIFLFDLHMTKRIFESDGAEAWVTLSKKLQKSALGDPKKRQEELIALHTSQDPDIICLQECDAALVDAYEKQGYFTPSDKGDAHPKETEGSVILYKESTFQKSSISVLSLDPRDITAYQEKGMSHRSIKKLSSQEVAIHKVYHQDMIWLVVSFHATSNGENTAPFLESLFALQKRVEAEEGKKVLLLVGMDGNTSEKTQLIQKKLKEDFKAIKKLVNEQGNAYTLIEQEGEDTSTVQKERSSFQVQFPKTHVLNYGISDFIIVSNTVSTDEGIRTFYKQDISLGPHGPSIRDKNPSDHRFVVLYFLLKKAN